MSCEHQQMPEGSRTLCTAGLRPTPNSHSMAEPRGCKNHPWETVMNNKETGLYNTCNTKNTKNTIKSSDSHLKCS